jgi:alkanesulfonate monooxygenase SsuD/methylene tetrahydromethanopterin reductase-like flavin-dependent oxidoreductase (luciferase family)
VYITDQNHGYEDIDQPISKQTMPERPVVIGDGSWLGYGTVVLPGAHIGRHVVVGANSVVTGYLPSDARNMGQEDQLEHDERCNHADEYLEVVYKLLEGSWEDYAVVKDRESGVYTDPAKVHENRHEGKYFKVPGIAITEPSPQRTPVIFQAGASKRGTEFAAANAEAVFVTCPTKETLAESVKKIRDAVSERQGSWTTSPPARVHSC